METHISKPLEKNEETSDEVTLEEIKEFSQFINSNLKDVVTTFADTSMAKLELEIDETEIEMKRRIYPHYVVSAESDYSHVEKVFETITSKHLGILQLNDKKGAPHVKIGDQIKKGQVLATVDTINISNQIKADRTGKLVEILEENGRPVEYGQILFVLEM
ncbi:MAG: acetyl-CoA carboxylase biotin carboxyl carrier protein [Vulcanimicrobiota bacterium]